MATSSSGYLPDRPRPAWFGALLATLFITIIVGGFVGAFRTPRTASNPFEKREAEPLPSLPDSRAALREYPARFERFFDDRFGMRATLVHIDHWVKATVFGVSPVSKVLIGKSGWLYFRGEDSKAFDRWYRSSEPIPDTTLVAARDELLRRQAFLASRRCAFPVPDKCEGIVLACYLRLIRRPDVRAPARRLFVTYEPHFKSGNLETMESEFFKPLGARVAHWS
jgi:hypothetical protein